MKNGLKNISPPHVFSIFKWTFPLTGGMHARRRNMLFVLFLLLSALFVLYESGTQLEPVSIIRHNEA